MGINNLTKTKREQATEISKEMLRLQEKLEFNMLAVTPDSMLDVLIEKNTKQIEGMRSMLQISEIMKNMKRPE